MIKRTLHKSIVLFFIFLFPVTITMCGGGDDSGSSTYTLSGRVTTEAGAGLQGVSVTAEGFGWGGCAPPSRTTTTDANGYYAFTETSPPAGQVIITPYKQGYAFSPSSVTATFNYADISGQDFVGSLIPYSISGKAATASGAGIEGITVTLSGAASATTTTDADGNYIFTGLLNGSYTLTPSMAAPGYTFTPPSRTVNIEYANVTGQNFTVTTYVISGRVTTAGGIGFSGVSITLSGAVSRSTTTDATGYYTLTVLQTGSYTITPSMSVAGYTFTPQFRTVNVSSGDVPGQDFSTVAYAVSGRISTSEGVGVSGVMVSVTGPASLSSLTGANGGYAVAVVQSGAYTITPSATCNAYFFTPADITTTVATADVTGQDFTATAVSHSISGRIITPDGAGAPGVTVNLSGAATLSTTTDTNGEYTFVVAQTGSYTIAPSISDYALKPERRSITLCGADITGQDFAESATWGRLYGSGSLYSVRQTSDNGYVAAGSAYGELQAFKLSANGGILLQKAYGEGVASSILETTDGYIVAGSTSSFGAGGFDLWVLKLDAGGAVLWQKAYGGTGADWGGSILQTTDGYIVAGQHESSAGTYDFWVLRLDASGNIVWQKSYGRGGASSIQQTSDGGYIAAGSHILKLDADGNRVWQKSYNGGAESIQQTADGGYIAAGSTYSFGAGSGDFWVLKLDGDGKVLWQKAYGETLSETAYSVRQASDGGYIVAGYVTFDLNTEFARVLKLDPDGNISWQKKYGGWPVRYRAYSLDITRDGRYIVSGSGSYFGTFGLVLMIDPYGEGCKVYSSGATMTSTTASPVGVSDSVVDTAAVETATAGAPKDTSATASQVCP